MIELKNVTKIYGKKKNQFTALKNISLTIPTGVSVAILGKSGSGKSTLMHAISGLDKPQKGQVIIDGQDILQLKSKRVDEFRAKKIGFIFQSFFVQGNESVIDNVSLPLEIARLPRKKRAHKINVALKAVDLYDKRKNRAKDLSGGQKQRLAIARAIELADARDAILIAGRGHETAQDVAGTDVQLDDRVETAKALVSNDFEILPDYRRMLEEA